MPALLTTLAVLLVGPLAQAEVLNQRLIYNQDPWDPENRLEVGDCQKGTDGSITCDTRPQGQVWVETLVNGNNN